MGTRDGSKVGVDDGDLVGTLVGDDGTVVGREEGAHTMPLHSGIT